MSGHEPDVESEYCVASGIFNVRLDHSDRNWSDYLYHMLEVMNKFTKTGFAFNCLSNYSDENKRRNDLFYADPCELFDHCKNSYSQNVTLLHDYGLYEFTILSIVMKENLLFSDQVTWHTPFTLSKILITR